MTNDELNTAIDTTARHSSESYGHYEVAKLMLKHLSELLAIQLVRAKQREETK